MPDDSGVDDNAYELLKDYFSPDEHDRVKDSLAPYMTPRHLLYMVECYRWLTEKRDGMPDVLPPSPEWAGWAEDGVEALAVIAAIRTLTEDLTGAYGWLITDARLAGASWTDVGNALGMTKQAAWEKFRDYATQEKWKKWPRIRAAAFVALGPRPGGDSPNSMVTVPGLSAPGKAP